MGHPLIGHLRWVKIIQLMEQILLIATSPFSYHQKILKNGNEGKGKEKNLTTYVIKDNPNNNLRSMFKW